MNNRDWRLDMTRGVHEGLRGDGGTLSPAEHRCQAGLNNLYRGLAADLAALAESVSMTGSGCPTAPSEYVGRLRALARAIAEISELG